MTQFQQSQTRLFGPRTLSRRGFLRPRYLFATLVVLGAAGLALHLGPSRQIENQVASAPAAVSAPALAMAQQPRFIRENSSAASSSLKAAFDATPVPPTYTFTPDTEETAGAKPVSAPAAANGKSGIAYIQDSISGILNAGSRLIDHSKTLSVGKGDTLMNLLVKNAVPRDEAYEAITALAKVYDPRDLNPGHEITVFFHEDPSVADPQFSGLSIQKDVVSSVRVNRAADGHYVVDQKDKEVLSRTRGFSGRIDNSLYVSAEEAGVPDNVILDLIRMYSWGVDFQRDIQSGDRFEVMYEEFVTEDGSVVPGKGDIAYAKLTLSGKDMPFYRYKDSSGDVDYYDETGQSAKKPLMKTPIDGARVSSGFGMRRHPVLGYSKMHKGIDFAAPRGTPIYAAGDGTIVKMGPFSTYGKYVRIRHRNGLETAYAHMNGFKAGLHSGLRVKQGQVIGYVGTTGRSTGPHLHYEILVGNAPVNPATVKLPTGKALKGKELKSFQAQVADASLTFKSVNHPMAVADNR